MAWEMISQISLTALLRTHECCFEPCEGYSDQLRQKLARSVAGIATPLREICAVAP